MACSGCAKKAAARQAVLADRAAKKAAMQEAAAQAPTGK